MIQHPPRLLITFLLLPCLFAVHVQAQPSDSARGISKRRWLNISYAEQSRAQKLDIYLPRGGDGPFPVIIAIHGGAFMMGDKFMEVQAIMEGPKNGYAVVSVNYRLSGEALFPKQVYDIKTAIRWVRAHAKEYHFNPDKLAVWGESAGGYLSAMAGTTGAVKELEDTAAGNAQQSSRVQAVVDWYGPTDFLLMDKELTETGNGTPNHNEARSPESRLMGQKITEIPDAVKLANPETYISPDDPPFLIMHGTKDQLVPTQQSIHLSEKLAKVLGKEKVQLHLLEGARHGGAAFDDRAVLKMVFTFLDKYLK